MITIKAVYEGCEGTSVAILQAMFRALQYLGADGKPIEIDGHCGKNTVYAINTFQTIQRAYGFECGKNGKNDGRFGIKCWERLLGINAKS